MRKAGDKLIWFQGRNTPAVAKSVEAARAKNVAGSKGPVVKVRSPNEKEAAQISKGAWVRSRPDGNKSSSSGSFKFRPQLKSKARGRDVS